MNETPQNTETYKNMVREEGTTGTSRDRFDAQPGLADEDTPEWAPPEDKPEPRPVEPVLTSTPQ